jgi:predicted HTH domain antitoxin
MMTNTIPDDVLAAAHLTERELVVEIAVMLFAQDKVTLAQASSLCGMDRLKFQHLLASRGIPVHYDVSELEKDLAVLRELGK